jgi:hypothetical protein
MNLTVPPAPPLLALSLLLAGCLQDIPTGMGAPCTDDSDCHYGLFCVTDIWVGYFEEPYTCLVPCTDHQDCRFGDWRGQFICTSRASGSEPAACVEDPGK